MRNEHQVLPCLNTNLLMEGCSVPAGVDFKPLNNITADTIFFSPNDVLEVTDSDGVIFHTFELENGISLYDLVRLERFRYLSSTHTLKGEIQGLHWERSSFTTNVSSSCLKRWINDGRDLGFSWSKSLVEDDIETGLAASDEFEVRHYFGLNSFLIFNGENCKIAKATCRYCKVVIENDLSKRGRRAVCCRGPECLRKLANDRSKKRYRRVASKKREVPKQKDEICRAPG